MLEGVVRFPAEFAARYRARGYWQDRSLRDTFDELFARYADRVAIIDRDQSVSYSELNERATHLALNLLDEGLKPLDRVVVQLPNIIEFVYLYFALQKIGAIPIMALPTHRFREISQFIELSGAVACATPDTSKDFDYRDLVRRIRSEGYTVLIVEQNVRQVLKVVDRAYLLEVGRMKASGRADELAASDDIRKAYMGL